jgi:APA family basic amino acid/polyamine antiporter
VYSQCLGSALGIGLILLNTGRDTASLFTFIILVATVDTLVMYLLGALASLVTSTGPLARMATGIADLFTLFAFYGSGLEANAWGLLMIAVGLLVRTATRMLQQGSDLPVRHVAS